MNRTELKQEIRKITNYMPIAENTYTQAKNYVLDELYELNEYREFTYSQERIIIDLFNDVVSETDELFEIKRQLNKKDDNRDKDIKELKEKELIIYNKLKTA